MNINFSPIFSDLVKPEYRFSEKALTIDGVLFDFSSLQPGDMLPMRAIDSPWVADNVFNVKGVLTVSLLLPHGSNPTQAEAFPAPLNPAPVSTLSPSSMGSIDFSKVVNLDLQAAEQLRQQVDQERDRRIAAGFTHAGKTYDSNPESMRRIDKAYAVACRALVEGAKAGNLRWADATQDFRWIAKDNTYVTMDAPTVVTFGEAAAAWETKHIYRARELKSMSPIPTDYTADKYWS